MLRVLLGSFGNVLWYGTLAAGIRAEKAGESPDANDIAPPLEVEREPCKQSLARELRHH